MNPLFSACLLLAVVSGSQAFLWSNNDAWNDLKVTWGINPFAGGNYESMPRTVEEAVRKGWTKDKDCTQGGTGQRFTLKGDRAVMLIFGANGYIAGIAAGIPKNLPLGYPAKNIQKFFDDEGDFWQITAYFTDPSTVCQRNALKTSTGDRVVFQSKSFSVSVATEEKDVDLAFWTKGKCFATMGLIQFQNAFCLKTVILIV
jgi:hypothetical protein